MWEIFTMFFTYNMKFDFARASATIGLSGFLCGSEVG